MSIKSAQHSYFLIKSIIENQTLYAKYKLNNHLCLMLLVILSMLVCDAAYSFDTSELTELKGYTLIDASYVTGDFDGADYDKLIELDNGMIFRFNEYSYSYSYRPGVIVFARYYPLKLIKQYIPHSCNKTALNNCLTL